MRNTAICCSNRTVRNKFSISENWLLLEMSADWWWRAKPSHTNQTSAQSIPVRPVCQRNLYHLHTAFGVSSTHDTQSLCTIRSSIVCIQIRLHSQRLKVDSMNRYPFAMENQIEFACDDNSTDSTYSCCHSRTIKRRRYSEPTSQSQQRHLECESLGRICDNEICGHRNVLNRLDNTQNPTNVSNRARDELL